MFHLNLNNIAKLLHGFNFLVSVSRRTRGSSAHLLNLISNMPKLKQPSDHPHKGDKFKYTPGTIWLQVIGSGAVGAPKSVYLFTDQSRYLFNCGEGTQRIAHEHKVRLARLEHIFITTSAWDSIGGLPGVSLTLQDCGVSHINLHGPPGLNELYEAAKQFIIMKNMRVKMATCLPSAPYEDSVMTVFYIPIMKEGSGTYKDFLDSEINARQAKQNMSRSTASGYPVDYDDTDYYAYALKKASENSDRSSRSQSPIKRSNSAIFRQPRREQICSMAYICKLKPRPGTLDLQKCVDFGVKPGPMLGILKNGEDIVLEDGRTIRSEDVRLPDDPGPIFIVLDIPNALYLDSLLSEELFHEFRTSHSPDQPDEKLPSVIVHFSPDNVVKDSRYQTFINDFKPDTKHIFVNDTNSCLGSLGVHRTQHKLNIIHEGIFPLIREHSGENIKTNELESADFNRVLTMNNEEKKSEQETAHGAKNFINGKTMTMYHLRPLKGYDTTFELNPNVREFISEVMDIEGIDSILKDFKETTEKLDLKKGGYPKIVFLGTGSCIPNKTRNTSGILVHISEESCILLDCGEGTFGQLVRFYGLQLANDVLRKLKAVYISHLHADHHLGLIGIFKGRQKAMAAMTDQSESLRLFLLAPQQILPWLNFYDKRFESISDSYELIPNASMILTEPGSPSHRTPYILNQLDLTNLQTCHVWHCPNAFGVALTINDKKITYSGDTIPCEDLVKLGHNSALLIHEATMEDELALEARVKMHSTTSQAIEMGNKMNAEFIMLTHFSQRYANMPRLKGLKPGIKLHNVGIAFDNMQVSLEQLPVLPHMYKLLEIAFAEYCQDLDLKAEKRAIKRIREQNLRDERRSASPTKPRKSKDDELSVSAKKQRDIS